MVGTLEDFMDTQMSVKSYFSSSADVVQRRSPPGPPAVGWPYFSSSRFSRTAAVDADADGDVPAPAGVRHGLDPVLAADVAGVDADLGRAALGTAAMARLVVKVDVRHQGQRTTPLQMAAKRRAASMSGTASRAIWHPACGQRADLRAGCPPRPWSGIEHGLDGHRRAAADGHAAHMNLLLSYDSSLSEQARH